MSLLDATPKGRRLLKQYEAFFRGLTTKDRIALFHDKDPDGISAGVILATLIHRLRGKRIDLRLSAPGSSYSLTPGLVQRMKRRKINVLIITDVSADHEPKLVRAAAKFARVIILDHHKLYTTFKEKNILVIKPQLLQTKVPPSAYSSSKFTYDLGNRLVDLTDLDWLAATGAIADIATGPWKRWLNGVFRRHKCTMKKDLFKTTIGQVAVTINSALVFSLKNVPLAFRVSSKATGPRQVLRSKLIRYHKAVQKEVQKWLDLLDEKAEKHPEHDLIVYYVEPKYHIKSTLSTILSLQHPHTTLVLLGPDKSMVTVSARRHDQKMHMNELLECAVKGLPQASAGGHIPAAGGRFRRRDLIRFRSQLLDCVKDL